MAQFAEKVEKDFQDFYDKGYNSTKGLVIKVNGQYHHGQVSIKEDGKPEIELKYTHLHEVNDIKIKKDLTLRSTGAQTLEGEANLNNHLKGTWFRHTTNWDSQHSTYDVKLSLESRYYENLASRFDFRYFKGGEWNFKPNFAYQMCPKSSLLFDMTYNGKSHEVNEVNVGFLHSPTERMQTILMRKIVGKVGSFQELHNNGLLTLRSRMIPRDFTILGFDYVYSLKTKTSSMVMALETQLQKGFTVRGKVHSGGDLEAATTIALNDKWNMTLSASTNAAEIAGKHKPNVGIKFEGFL